MLGHAGDNPAAIGMADEHDAPDVLKTLPLHDVDHVGDVHVEIHIAAHEVRTLAQARERGREDFMAEALEPVRDAAPAPAALRGAVNQHERLGSRRSLGHGCPRSGQGGRSRAGNHRAPHCIYCRLLCHRISPRETAGAPGCWRSDSGRYSGLSLQRRHTLS